MSDQPDKKKTYLLDDIEVIMTGRAAKRGLRSGKVDERIEITPANAGEGSWKKWVRRTDLFEIENTNNEILP